MTLRPMTIRRILGRPKGEAKGCLALGHRLCPLCWGERVHVAGAQPYLGPRTRSGDMMIDGVPDVRASQGCGRSISAGDPPRVGVAPGGFRELTADIR